MRNDIFFEIRLYVIILLRRWPFIIVPMIIVTIIGIARFSLPEPTYKTSVQYIVSQDPTISAENNEESRQFVWLNSQYVVNTITDWSNGTEFAGRVSAEMQARGVDADTRTVAIALETGTIRSKLEVFIDHPDQRTVQVMAESATIVLNRDNLEAIPQLGHDPALITPIDEIEVEMVSAGLKGYLDLPIRIIIAAAMGVAVALFAEYIDPKIRTKQQIAAIHLPLIGEIPVE